MKLLDFLLPAATVYDMKSTDKEGALVELLDALIEAGAVKKSKKDSILDALVKREELGSTGIGMGVAIPHTKHDDVRKLTGVVGRSVQGRRFQGAGRGAGPRLFPDSLASGPAGGTSQGIGTDIVSDPP